MMKIKVKKDFSRTPGPRHRIEGDFSGEEFREKVLWPKVEHALESGEPIEVDLDGTAGYGTSFLEEAFGGLIRHNGLTRVQAASIVIISNEESYWLEAISEYINQAANEAKR